MATDRRYHAYMRDGWAGLVLVAILSTGCGASLSATPTAAVRGYDVQMKVERRDAPLALVLREHLDAIELQARGFLERKFGPHEFLPFGGGHRRCVGAAFASFEMRIVVGALLRQFDVALQDPKPPKAVRRNITMAPRGGVPVVLRRKRPGGLRLADHQRRHRLRG